MSEVAIRDVETNFVLKKMPNKCLQGLCGPEYV